MGIKRPSLPAVLIFIWVLVLIAIIITNPFGYIASLVI